MPTPRNKMRQQFILLTTAILTLATPTLHAAPRKLTLHDLKSLLTSSQGAKDDALANQLKRVELSEQLAPSVLNEFTSLAPGPLSTEQIYVLEARSALLPPPTADLPAALAPDPATQQALLANAQAYAAHTYSQLPRLTATRLTGRFQDLIEAPPQSGGGLNSGVSVEKDPIFSDYAGFIRLMNTRSDQVDLENGLILSTSKEKPAWGLNGMVASTAQPPVLNAILEDINSSKESLPRFLRWELVNGQLAAVFSFSVDRKRSHYAVAYCCFPQTDTTGTSHLDFGSAGGKTMSGNMQNVANWHPFQAKAAYHGQLFLHSKSGAVLRLITQADFKPTDFVHSESTRIDYEFRTLNSQTLLLPVRTVTLTELVPNGDSNAARYAIRHQIVTEDLKDFALAGGAKE